MILPEQKPWMDKKSLLRRKTRQISLINENSALEHKINNELTVKNNKCDTEAFSLGHEIIGTNSSRASG